MTFNKLRRGKTIFENKQPHQKLPPIGCLYCKNNGSPSWKSHAMRNEHNVVICSTAIIESIMTRISIKTFTSNTCTFIWHRSIQQK